MHFVRVRHFVVVVTRHNVVDGRHRFLNRSSGLVNRVFYFLEDFVFLGKSGSSMVSFTFTMSAMTWQPASVTCEVNFLVY